MQCISRIPLSDRRKAKPLAGRYVQIVAFVAAEWRSLPSMNELSNF
jgi:hypothetical protein